MAQALGTGVLSSLLPARESINGLVKSLEITGRITSKLFPSQPHNYRFSTLHTDQAYERLSEEEKQLLP